MDRQTKTKRATGLIKEIIQKMNIDIDVPEDIMTAADAQHLLSQKTQISTYIIEMLHYAYNISLEDLTDLTNSDATEILNNFKRAYNELHPVVSDQKITWHLDKSIYNKRFGDVDPYLCTEQHEQNQNIGNHKFN